MKRFAFFAAALLIATPALAVQAPKLKLDSIANLPVVTMKPYDESADAERDLAAAFARARKRHTRVLIDMGGNWCGDCVVMANIFELPEMKPFMKAHFEVVSVDTGRKNKNMQIPARYGVDLNGGVPAMLVVTADGKPVNPKELSALEDARHMTPQALADWLAKWAK
ncbi:MAG: thioredoxin family protein [Alphaproteobacteria bacterium]|nr:thioredoxin family protein [Alphaproteobacteria bacterium]